MRKLKWTTAKEAKTWPEGSAVLIKRIYKAAGVKKIFLLEYFRPERVDAAEGYGKSGDGVRILFMLVELPEKS